MTPRLAPWPLLAALASPTATFGQDEGPSSAVPELQVLSNYIGTWDVVSGPKESPAAKGAFTAKWILDGRFVQGTGSLKTADGSNDFLVKTLMTYDQAKKTYRRWSFMSNGMTSESEGTWDAKTKTMTLVTRYGEFTQTAKSVFSKPGVETWTMVGTDKNKRVISEMSGTNTQRKE